MIYVLRTAYNYENSLGVHTNPSRSGLYCAHGGCQLFMEGHRSDWSIL